MILSQMDKNMSQFFSQIRKFVHHRPAVFQKRAFFFEETYRLEKQYIQLHKTTIAFQHVHDCILKVGCCV